MMYTMVVSVSFVLRLHGGYVCVETTEGQKGPAIYQPLPASTYKQRNAGDAQLHHGQT